MALFRNITGVTMSAKLNESETDNQWYFISASGGFIRNAVEVNWIKDGNGTEYLLKTREINENVRDPGVYEIYLIGTEYILKKNGNKVSEYESKGERKY
ncbi:putative 3-demethylubiquinone-9 3-methyltransferase (glyoxalase superfamily) [Fusobacterium sp. PH5-7]|uniref:hypothetical protein n=1 Tax=Fusobacterium TaxID=848 RepID=UPI00247433D3|nr:hypothetical protein [Fusobacterium sp. PH5-7]MDH6457794.1 putative 3-demethylubiquinone-9 3-methyltransferase (glyoxalase superfamily) [Fusobacterium sp. PH5-7]